MSGRRTREFTRPEKDVVKRIRLAMDQDDDLTQGNVAKRLGTTRVQVNRWYNGHEMPSAKHLIVLPSVLRVSPAWLLEGSGPMYASVPQSADALEAVREKISSVTEALDDLKRAADFGG
jgi:transcriptional regulator with XRE-family HTH domain